MDPGDGKVHVRQEGANDCFFHARLSKGTAVSSELQNGE